MTIADLKRRADADAADTSNARRMMAGRYAQKAADSILHRDWTGAMDYLLKAAARDPAYSEAIPLIQSARGGAQTSDAKRETARANGAKGGRPVVSAGERRTWTFAEVFDAIGTRRYTAPAGRGLWIKAACNYDRDAEPQMGEEPAFFDLQPNWGDRIGPHDDCGATVDALIRRITAKFPPVGRWQYDAANGTIEQTR